MEKLRALWYIQSFIRIQVKGDVYIKPALYREYTELSDLSYRHWSIKATIKERMTQPFHISTIHKKTTRWFLKYRCEVDTPRNVSIPKRSPRNNVTAKRDGGGKRGFGTCVTFLVADRTENSVTHWSRGHEICDFGVI